MRQRTRCGQEDVIPIETCRLTHVLVRTASMPNVEEWCDSVRHHTPEFGGLGDNEDLESGYKGATYDGDGLEVVKGEGSSR